MSMRIALAGNPNCGKTTMYNALTGAVQTVGNWPGVTVEKKEGKLKGDKEVIVTDLPGIYSLSPYTAEEVVARDYLVTERPEVILNIVDGTNLERNLYLTTQLVEIGLPVVVAINMIDIVEKTGDTIDCDALAKELGCEVFAVSALKNKGLAEAIAACKNIAGKEAAKPSHKFSDSVEAALASITEAALKDVPEAQKRYAAIKAFERDVKALEKLGVSASVEETIAAVEKEFDDDAESIITGERYEYIAKVAKGCFKKKAEGELSVSDKIDRIVTNRWLGLPIFALIMFVIYYISVSTVGGLVTDWTNDVFVGEWLQGNLEGLMEGIGCADWLIGLVVEGIIGGIGAMLGFMPQMFILFIFLAILEDIGYMARIAFVMDRVFRKFGLSGKSFIPMLVGTGCGLPGIMAARTIESKKDRRLTIMTVTFMPCGAKLPVIACIAGALFANSGSIAFSCYVLGIASVIITGVMLKKTKLFAGEATPFVMELPAYHVPSVKNVAHSIWDRLKSFGKKTVTIFMICSIFVWFISSFGWDDGVFGMIEDVEQSVGAFIGNLVAWIFIPLGFANWQAVIASVIGLAAKEEVVGVLGEVAGMAEDALEVVEEGGSLSAIGSLFSSPLAGYSFLVFNLLCCPCFAAMNTMRAEMQNGKLTAFAICYQIVFAYAIALIIYQFAGLAMGLVSFGLGTVLALVALALLLFFLFRKGYQVEKKEA